MNDVTTAACGCGDCRQYRLWRIERTDEWDPTRDWDRDAASRTGDDGFSTGTRDSLATEPTDREYLPIA